MNLNWRLEAHRHSSRDRSAFVEVFEFKTTVESLGKIGILCPAEQAKRH